MRLPSLAMITVVLWMANPAETCAQCPPQACSELRASLCDLCGADSLLCEADCDSTERLFCEATPRSPSGTIDRCRCQEVLTDLAGFPPEERPSLCEGAEETVLISHEVPRACEFLDDLLCWRCTPLDPNCEPGASEALAASFGSSCGQLLLATRSSGQFGVDEPTLLCFEGRRRYGEVGFGMIRTLWLAVRPLVELERFVTRR